MGAERREDGRRREDRERARLVDQVLAAEQNERRRLADYLHDTSVQSLSAVALVLEAAVQSLEAGEAAEARELLIRALERQRAAIRSLRDLSFELEPVVLRDQGFGPALDELARRLGIDETIHVDIAVDAASQLSENGQAALYQIIRDALHAAIRRRPSRIAVMVQQGNDDAIEAVIADDAPGERRRTTFDEIAERARALSGQLVVEGGPDGGTTVRVTLPAYAVRQ